MKYSFNLLRFKRRGGDLIFAGVLTAESPMLLALQPLNAIYIGMLCLQDLMPGQAGSATTLYTHTMRAGWIIAGSVTGVAAESWR